MGNALGYPQAVWALFRDTPRAGRFAPGTPGVLVSEAGTPAGRGRIRLECRIDKNLIADSHFQAWGCPYTIASAAWAAGWLVGRTAQAAAAFRAADVTQALEIPDDRTHCSLMAEDAVRGLFTRTMAAR
ncbi:MAG TPA: iron-sulfur cluster assembly scaffold protein [Nevskiaceae bacterium]|nr:iron-sulfur cluster assembly scaffold protein [Nevskiaceae bacterium]